jgi:hypothetical protein
LTIKQIGLPVQHSFPDLPEHLRLYKKNQLSPDLLVLGGSGWPGFPPFFYAILALELFWGYSKKQQMHIVV